MKRDLLTPNNRDLTVTLKHTEIAMHKRNGYHSGLQVHATSVYANSDHDTYCCCQTVALLMS